MIDIEDITEEYRKRIVRTAWKGKGGHITSALSIADIMAVLFFGNVLKHNPQNPHWSKRDRLILSKAHAGVGYYTILAMEGYFPMSDLDQYCQPGQHLGDHSNASINGVENSGGSLGHGLGIAAGKAMAAKLNNADYITYVITGDGECQEGSIWESALFIGNRQLNNLVWIIDYNHLQANGTIESSGNLEPLSSKLKDFRFDVKSINGHNHKDLFEAMALDRNNLPQKPTAIIANTIKGYGIPLFEGKEGWHGRTPTVQEYEAIIKELGMSIEEFEKL